MRRGSLAHARAGADARAAERADRLGGDHARAPRRRARGAARRARTSASAARGRRAARRCCAGWRPTSSATCARRRSPARATSPSALEWSFGTEPDDPPAAPARRRAGAVTGRVDRVDRRARAAPRSCATTRAARSPAARSGRTTAAAGRALPARRARAAGAASRWPASTSRSRAASSARAGSSARARPAPTRAPTSSTTPASRRRWRRRAARARTAAELHAGRIAPVPRALLEPRLPPPGDLPRRGAEGRCRRREALHARAARGDRRPGGSVAAGRGRGLGQDRGDGRAVRRGRPRRTASRVGAILTLTFTEKAAAELRERIRRRFTELGEDEHARAVDAAWVGTIHGFCARVLRAQPLAAGLDPRFTVLDEAARGASRPGVRDALEAWVAARGRPGARRRRRLRLGPRAADRHRARRAAQPRGGAAAGASRRRRRRPTRRRSPRRPPRPPRALDGAAAGVARAAGAGARSRPRSGSRRGDGVPLPGALDAPKLAAGAKALEHDDCVAYREAWAAYRAAVRRLPRPARRWRCSTPCSTRSAPPTRRRRRRARRSTSTTSSCACATCWRDPARAPAGPSASR